MQHTVDKGLFFSFLDSRYSGNIAEREAILLAMRAADPNVFRDAGTLNAQGTAGAGNQMGGTTSAAVNARMQHLYEHWFGYSQAGQTNGLDDWIDPHALASYTAVTTGWWSRWHGDAFDIFRLTLIRAVEISIGLEIGHNPPGTRNWPIDFLWICGAPKFEGWVSWREVSGSGRVNVVMTTPSIGLSSGAYNSGISLSLTQGVGTVHGSADYEEIARFVTGTSIETVSARPVQTPQQTHGLWVIGHEFSQVEVQPGVFPSQPSPNGDWLVDVDERGSIVSGWPHDVVTVQPAEEDGGVLMAGRTWQ
jgi:hypothetical protein